MPPDLTLYAPSHYTVSYGSVPWFTPVDSLDLIIALRFNYGCRGTRTWFFTFAYLITAVLRGRFAFTRYLCGLRCTCRCTVPYTGQLRDT